MRPAAPLPGLPARDRSREEGLQAGGWEGSGSAGTPGRAAGTAFAGGGGAGPASGAPSEERARRRPLGIVCPWNVCFGSVLFVCCPWLPLIVVPGVNFTQIPGGAARSLLHFYRML